MANINSTVLTGQTNPSSSNPLTAASLANGKIRFATIETTVASLGATADTFSLVRLQVGAKVVPGLSKVICESPGTTVTGTIGDAGDPDRYMASNALGGAAQDDFWTAAPGVAAYVGYTIAAGNETIIWTSSTIGTPTTTAKIVFLVAFIVE